MENTQIENTTDVIEDINEETLLSLDETLELDQEQTEIAEGKCKKEGEDMEDEKMTEAEVSSDEEFTAYAKGILKAAHGDNYDETKAMAAIEGILKKADGDYGSAIGMLTSGLGEEMEDEKEMTEAIDWNIIQSMYVKDIIDVVAALVIGGGIGIAALLMQRLRNYLSDKADERDSKASAQLLKSTLDKILKDSKSKELITQIKSFPYSSKSTEEAKKNNEERKKLVRAYSARLKTLLSDDEYALINDIYNNTIRESVETQEEVIEENSTISIDTSDITRLVESETGLTEEFKEKATTIFEAAVKSKLKETEETLKESYAVALIEEVETIKEEFVEKIDNYLTYAVESWVEDNKVAIEGGLRTQIAENFIQSLKTVFVENYIEVPESKQDLVAEMETSIAQLQNESSELENTVLALNEKVNSLTREKVISESTTDLADTQVEKLKSLLEDIECTSETSFRKKVTTIKEFYLNGAAVEETETLVEENANESSYITTETVIENETIAEETVSPAMQKYLTALSRLNKANEATIPVR
jgi:hypothetical protein